MTTNAPTTDDSRLRQAVTTVRTSRPAQAVATHRKPLAATVLALTGAATAILLILRKRTTRSTRSGPFAIFRRR